MSTIISPNGDELREGCMAITAVFRCGERGIITDQQFSEEMWQQAQRNEYTALYIIRAIEKTRQTFISKNATEIINP